ncbi:MAG: glycoside hydrolase family protein [Lentisphaeria bacterium]|nr:glycoside hydrolase family protein [Lentisphaeria bacterium]
MYRYLLSLFSLFLFACTTATAQEDSNTKTEEDKPLLEEPASIQRSSKRGICINKMSESEAKDLAKGCSWYYNWYFKSDFEYESVDMEFYPMVWGGDAKYLEGFTKYLQEGNKPQFVLAINEPNLKEQANMTPEATAKVFKKIDELAKEYNFEVVGPHMALGSGGDASIKAYDPLQKKDVVYTYMIPYMDAFYYYVGGVENMRAVAVHTYGNIHEVKWLIGMLEKKYPGKPIWVTEFAWWAAKTPGESYTYMKEAVELFEKSESVEKYAWFMSHLKDHPTMTLFDENEKMTKLGKAYISLPFWDPKTKKMITPVENK